MKKLLYFLFCFSFLLLISQNTKAESQFKHVIYLEPGWNLISTPRLLESHEFSASSTSSNYDIYVMNPNSISKWSTMAEIGQTEFEPLFGYFINNKTENTTTLTFNYRNDVSPNERFFSRNLSTGWNVIGVANPSYALKQNTANNANFDNVKNIISSIGLNTQSIYDLTANQASKSSVKVSNNWLSTTYEDANDLDDFRETKAYVVFNTLPSTYIGFQNNDPIVDVSNDFINIDPIISTSSVSVGFGENNVLLANFSITNNLNRKILVKGFNLYNNGSVLNDIVSNLELFINGNKITNGIYADGYGRFDFNYETEEGSVLLVEVRGSVGVASVNDNINFYLREVSDFFSVDYIYGNDLNIATTYTNSNGIIINLKASDFSIEMDKTAVPATDVKPDTKNVVLAKISLKSNGENATLTQIKHIENENGFFIEGNVDYLENIRLTEVGGGTYDLTSSISGNKITLSLNEEIFFAKGVTRSYELRADVKADAPEGATFRTILNGTALDIEGDVSGAKITSITPAEVTGSLITVKSASLSLNEVVLTNATVVGGSNELVYKAMVEAGSADDVRIQSIKIASTSGNAFTNDNVSKLDIYLDGKLMKSESNRITSGAITFSSLSNNIVPAGREVALEVKATFASTFASGATGFTLQTESVSARSVDGNKVVTVADPTGNSRSILVATKGSLAVDMLTSDTKVKDSLLLAGSQTEAGRYLGEIKFTTTNEEIKVTKLTLTASTTLANKATSADLNSVKLVKADGTVVAEKTVSSTGSVTFDPFNVTFEADKGTSLFIVVVAKGMNVSGDATSTASSTKNIVYRLGAVESTGLSSGEEITPIVASTTDSKAAYIVGSKLNSIANALADGKLTNETNRTIAKYTFVFDNGSNRDMNNDEMKAVLENLVINLDKSADVELADINLYVDGSSSDKAAAATTTVASTTTATTITFSDDLGALVNSAEMDGTVTLVVTATVSGIADRSWLSTDIFVNTGNVVYSTGGNSHDVVNKISVTEVNGALLSD